MKKNSLLIFILSLAFFIRVIPINQSYWLDEAINVSAAASIPFGALITDYAIGDFHPPIYHVFLRSWILFFGDHEVATRMLSVVFGVATVYYTFRLGKLIFTSDPIKFLKLEIPLYSLPAGLLAISGLHIYYSGEARMYSMAAFFTTMAMYYATKLQEEIKWDSYKKTLKELFISSKSQLKSYNSILSIIAIAGMLYSDYVPWMVFPLFFVIVPVQSILALLTLIPWLPIFITQLQTGLGVASEYPLWGQVVGGLSLKNMLLIPLKFITGRVSFDPNWLFFGVLLPVIVVGVVLSYRAIQQLDRKQKLFHYVPTLWLAVPLFFGLLVSFKISLLSYFRFIFILPAFYLFLTQGFTKINDSWKEIALAILFATTLASTSAYLFMPQFQREDWRGFSAWVDAQETASAVTLIPSLAQSDPYLYYQKDVPIYDSFDDLETLPDAVYLVRYVQEIFDAEDQLRKTLEELDYIRVEQKNFNGVIVWHYQKTERVFAFNYSF